MELENARQIFTALLVSGAVLAGIEIFVPGGVLGLIGTVALIGAMFVGFYAFPGYGALVALAIMTGGAFGFMFWLKVAPDTWIGKKLTVSRDLGDAKGTKPGLDDLLHKKGVAMCALRPSGFAKIEGRKVDVVTTGEMVDSDTNVEVIDIESNRVVVREITA